MCIRDSASSEAAQTYANVLVVKEGNENDPAIQALYAALTSDKVKDYINETYDGAVVPIFYDTASYSRERARADIESTLSLIHISSSPAALS